MNKHRDVKTALVDLFHSSFAKAYRDCNDGELAFMRAYSECKDKLEDVRSFMLAEYYCRMKDLFEKYQQSEGQPKVELAKKIVRYARLICLERPISRPAVEENISEIRAFLRVSVHARETKGRSVHARETKVAN